MKFFDANCCIGRLSVPMPKSICSIKELVETMEQGGVDEALIYHSYSREYAPDVGNRKLLEEIKGHENVHPCWILLPHHTGEMPPPGELVDEMIANNVRAARVFPKTHNWSLSEWCAGNLLKALEDSGIPLFIDIEETDWNQAYSICANHPNLSVILTRAPFRLSRQIYALLAETSNLYIDTSFFQLHGGIEDVCEKFGAKRLLFGSAMPLFNPEPSVMAVNYAGISDDEKSMIAGGNLHSLLGHK